MATVDVLFEGYTEVDGDRDRTASTVSLIRSGDFVAVMDPGLVPSPAAILEPLRRFGFGPEDVTDVVFSHHHPDHTLNAALFPRAKFRDAWATYYDDYWVDRVTDLAPGVTVLDTPGHSDQDISLMVETDGGLVVLTHLWWFAAGPPDDPYATDAAALHQSRAKVLELRPALIVPGHGPAFAPDDDTPR
jgi:glyoxylase-like metal-dependent hydrolase (beta-lactamase superfamily II)